MERLQCISKKLPVPGHGKVCKKRGKSQVDVENRPQRCVGKQYHDNVGHGRDRRQKIPACPVQPLQQRRRDGESCCEVEQRGHHVLRDVLLG